MKKTFLWSGGGPNVSDIRPCARLTDSHTGHEVASDAWSEERLL